MSSRRSNFSLGASLVFAVTLWGASNVGTKHLVADWPPMLTGGTRFLAAGFLLLAALRGTNRLRPLRDLDGPTRRALWYRTGLALALYIGVFYWALNLTSASHVALYLGASPVWAALWDQGAVWNRTALRKYIAALLALSGVVVLFVPVLKLGQATWMGEVLGFLCSVLWTAYGYQCRRLGTRLSGAEITAHTMWRAGLLVILVGLFELRQSTLPLRTDLILVQLYCIVGGGVAAYWLWNHALRCWPTSRVYLFNNLVPVTTMAWAWALLGETLTPTFGIAMVLIVVGVLLGQGIGSGFPGGLRFGRGTARTSEQN